MSREKPQNGASTKNLLPQMSYLELLPRDLIRELQKYHYQAEWHFFLDVLTDIKKYYPYFSLFCLQRWQNSFRQLRTKLIILPDTNLLLADSQLKHAWLIELSEFDRPVCNLTFVTTFLNDFLALLAHHFAKGRHHNYRHDPEPYQQLLAGWNSKLLQYQLGVTFFQFSCRTILLPIKVSFNSLPLPADFNLTLEWQDQLPTLFVKLCQMVEKASNDAINTTGIGVGCLASLLRTRGLRVALRYEGNLIQKRMLDLSMVRPEEVTPLAVLEALISLAIELKSDRDVGGKITKVNDLLWQQFPFLLAKMEDGVAAMMIVL